MNIFTHFFTKYFSNSGFTPEDIDRDLIQSESNIGRHIFGTIPKGVKREFFRLDDSTWVWHEQTNGVVTVSRYLVKPTEILKSVNGGSYERLSILEAERFVKAAEIYTRRVNQELYGQLQAA